MAQASNYLELGILNSLFGKTSTLGALATAPTIRVALLTAVPADTDTGSTIVEATYTGYARITTVAADWAAAAAGLIDNANVLTFPACTGGSSTITHFALVDAASAGNLLCWGALTNPSSLAVSNGITPSFAVGALDVTLD